MDKKSIEMMKALNVTKEIQNKNGSFIRYHLGINIFSSEDFPSRFNGVENVSSYYQDRIDLHEEDGFWEVEQKRPLDQKKKYGVIQQKGEEKKYHYPVIDKTPEEIKNEILNASSSNRQIIVDDTIRIQNENTVIESFQSITDAKTMLENLDVFPLWEANVFYKKDRKVKHFTNQELKLYKVGQDHSSSSIYPPDAQGVEALYNEVAPPGVIPEWKPPTGAHNAYAIGDKVTYKGQTWESKIVGNTTVPDGDVPYNRYWKPIN